MRIRDLVNPGGDEKKLDHHGSATMKRSVSKISIIFLCLLKPFFYALLDLIIPNNRCDRYELLPWTAMHFVRKQKKSDSD